MTQQLAARVLVAVVGEAGSGKTTLVTALAKNLQAPVVSFGGYVRQEAQRQGLPLDRPTLQSLGQALIDKHGAESFGRQVIASLPGPHKILLVDGVRSLTVWQAVRTLAQESLLVYLDVPTSVRTTRVAERDQRGVGEVVAIMQHPLELAIPELRNMADLLVAGVTDVNEIVAEISERVLQMQREHKEQ